jgi:hypothetical protein
MDDDLIKRLRAQEHVLCCKEAADRLVSLQGEVESWKEKYWAVCKVADGDADRLAALEGCPPGVPEEELERIIIRVFTEHGQPHGLTGPIVEAVIARIASK